MPLRSRTGFAARTRLGACSKEYDFKPSSAPGVPVAAGVGVIGAVYVAGAPRRPSRMSTPTIGSPYIVDSISAFWSIPVMAPSPLR